MYSDFEEQWRLARTLENEGRPLDAKPIYETLLAADPRRLYVRLRLSAIEQGQGHYRAARAHALACADAVRAARPADLAAVTRRLLTFDEPQLVAELIAGVDWDHPDIVRNSAVLSQHLWLTNEMDRAIELIDVAQSHAQPSHLLSYSRANALRYLGRMDEATAAYEHSIALAPDFALAHWSLASHSKAEPPGSRIERIRAAQARQAANASDEPYFHYALFKEYDAAGDVASAWSSLEQGARAKRRSLRYDPAAEAAGFEALARMPCEPLAPAGDAVRVPVFILGMPRTGTTLLERIVGGHSQVTPGGELNDFHSALCLATDRFLGAFVTADDVARLGGIDPAEAGNTYLARTAARARGKAFLTDKNPANFVYAGLIARALPTAKILCLRRGAMDACMSNLKELFANDIYGYSYDLAELADYYLRFDRLCAHWKHVLPGRFLEVDYEALVSETPRVTAEVLDFCGLPFEAGCVDILSNTAPVSTASSSQVREPINTRGIGAWRRYAEFLEPLRARLEAAGKAE